MKGAITYDVRGDMRPILADLEKVNRDLVPAATVSALNRTATHIRSQALKQISAAIAVPQKALKKKVLIAKASRRRQSAAVYLKHRPVNPWAVSGARARKEAKAAGGWEFKPGWRTFRRTYKGKAHGPTSFPKGIVLKRRGKERWPLDAVGIELKGAIEMVAKLVRESGVFFARQFTHELKYRIERRQTLAAEALREAA